MNWRVCSESYKFSKIFPFWKGLSLICSSGHFFLAWQPWRKTFVNVPETSLLSRKPWNFEQFLSETLLCKCSSGHIEISFDIPAQFFSGEFQILPGQRSKLMTNQLCKNIFPEIFFGRTLMQQFWQTCHYFFQKKSKFLCSKSEQLKKQFFKVRFPQMFPLNTCIAVLAHLDSLFATEQKKNCCRSKFLTKNIVSLVK